MDKPSQKSRPLISIPLDEDDIIRARCKYGRDWKKEWMEATTALIRDELGLESFLRPKAIAVLMNCSTKTAYRYITDGKFAGVVHLNNKCVMVPTKEVMRLMTQKLFIDP